MPSRPRILATRVEHVNDASLDMFPSGVRVVRVELLEHPPAMVDHVQHIMGGWWIRAGGYPVGVRFGSVTGREVKSGMGVES